MRHLTISLACLVAATLGTSALHADVPVAQRYTWSGAIDFFATGASIAIDGADADTTQVDTILHPATVEVLAADLPADATLVQAFLYWSGTVPNHDCVGAARDPDVDFTPPDAAAPVSVTADVCHCSDAGVTSYDTEVCRADVTALVTNMIGSYTVDGFRASIQNRSTDNASFSLVLVYAQADLPPRRVALYDGVQTMYTAAGTTPVTTAITLAGLKVDDPPQGDLTWYVLEGDKGGSGAEGVTLAGQPGGLSIQLGDAINPVTNPMNHTINTTEPPQTDTFGVDIDRFPIDDALTTHDSSLLMTFSAGTDKYWLAYNIVGVNVFEAVFGAASTKTWELQDDADENGAPTAGDTIRYTIHLENTGRASGAPVVDDDLDLANIASWSLMSAGNGTATTEAAHLHVVMPVMAVGQSADIVYDVVLSAADRADESELANTALFDATPDGDAGALVAAPVVIRHDADGDGVFDHDDNCVHTPNPAQADADEDGIGDACDACPADATNDPDGDHVCDDVDNCVGVANTTQADADDDGLGDACDACPHDAANDADDDGACDDVDNCLGLANASQADADHDGAGDACDVCPHDASDDADDDGACEDVDNCPGLANADQADGDHDGIGDACDTCPNDAANDADHDGHCADADNCPAIANADQADLDHDGLGDACDSCIDVDGDKACDGVDNCPGLANADQADQDHDGIGDACDACPADAANDVDKDGICGDVDNCPAFANHDQADGDHDGAGDGCDPCPDDAANTCGACADADQDGACDDVDNCKAIANADQADQDHDGVGDACDACPADASNDKDKDGVCGDVDNCKDVANKDQADRDHDGVGDACDTACPDEDADGICDGVDNCPGTPNADQADGDHNGVGDACEAGPPIVDEPAPSVVAEGGASCAGGASDEAVAGLMLALGLLVVRARRVAR